MILELMRCEFIDRRRENVLLIGGSGSGKTHLATGRLAMEACVAGRKRVRFYRVTELATQLLEAREERQLSRPRSRLAKLDLLILDELGYVPASKVGAGAALRRDQHLAYEAVERDRDDGRTCRSRSGRRCWAASG